MDNTRRTSEETILLQRCIEQLHAGDASVRGELLNIAQRRLMRLAARIRRDFPALRDRELDDQVVRQASLNLYQSLYDAPINDVRHFYHVAASAIRRELVELCRGCATSDQASTTRTSLDRWSHRSRFHDVVDALPAAEREVFELVWYHELSRGEAAELLDLPLVEVRRLWRAARWSLHESLGDENFPAKSRNV